MARILIVATSRKTRGGISSVIKAHERGEQWKKFHCTWIGTHRDGPTWRKIWYFFTGTLIYILLLPFSDIVHMHVSFQGSLNRKCIYMWFAKLLRKKTIVHFHPPTPDVLSMPNHGKKYKYLFGNADVVLVLSNMWKKWIQDVLGIGGDNLTVLYNPCPTVDEASIVSVKDKDKYILFAGTLITRKGYKGLLKGFSRIANLFPEWKVLLAGVDEEKEVERLVQELKIDHQVKILGWCDNNKMKELYRHAGIFCLASSGEGFPMVVLEAWAYSVPVVTTPVGGLPDIVKEGVNALTFDFDDDVALSRQIKRLIDDSELREKLSNEGLKLANGIFNIEVVNKQLGTIYSKIHKECLGKH